LLHRTGPCEGLRRCRVAAPTDEGHLFRRSATLNDPQVKSAEVVTNPAGASKGFAVVIYQKKADALKAIETYNGVPLDGAPPGQD
jgi:RNA recognition motif-containing protein